MATTSTVPAARAALVSLLAAALPTTQVAYSHPGEAAENNTVFLGDATVRHELATMRAGRRTRDESWSIDVWVLATADGPDAQTASEQAWTLVAAVENTLANDASAGLGQPFWVAVGDATERLTFDEQRRGWESAIRLTVEGRARLT